MTAKRPIPPTLAPTEAEALAIGKALERQALRPARARLAISGTAQAVGISNPHTDAKGWSAHVNEAFGTTSSDYALSALGRIGGVMRPRGEGMTAAQANAALALLGAIEPRDELEAAIAEQIVVTHFLSVDFLTRAAQTDTMQKCEAYTGMATKLSRTMAAHAETLGKLRAGGKQRIEVIYVNGPAVIGDNAQTVISGAGAHGGGGLCGKGGQSLAAAALAGGQVVPGLQMRGQDAARDALPIASGGGAEKMSDARRDEPRSPNRQGQRALSDGAAHPRASRGAAADQGRPKHGLS